MLNKLSTLLAATAVAAFSAGAAYADPDAHGNYNQSGPSTGYDPNQSGYQNGYNYGYDDGYARRERNDSYRAETYRSRLHDGDYQRGAYYYGSDCQDNAVAGTIAGAAIGGVIGNQFGHGDGRTAATVGGVIIGGVAGNSIASDMNCSDRHYAMSTYDEGFEGDIGRDYRWRNADDDSYGSFTPVREYSRDGNTCRDFHETGYGNGRHYDRNGTACRRNDGNWYMD